MVRRLPRFLTVVASAVNWKMGLLGAVFLGGLVLFLNRGHGWDAAWPAALKQAAYTLLSGGFIVRLCERLARRRPRRGFAVATATIVCSAVTVSATLLVHSVRGTPETWLSTLPTLCLAPPAFFTIALSRTRRRAHADPT